MIVKFCGLRREKDIEVCNILMPDYIGFVFWDKSRRNISPQRALELRKGLNSEIKVVGVFVDEDPAYVAELVKTHVIDVPQLHGSEDEDYIRELRSRISSPIFKAFHIKSPEDSKMINESSAELLLLDAGKGCGVTFDWELIRGINRPYLLAGGLDADNITNAILKLDPYGVDVSSGIETDGFKDPDKMKLFMERVRRAAPTRQGE